MDTLETERLVLRMFRESDLDNYAEMCADPEVMRFLNGYPQSREEAWRNMAMVVGHWRRTLAEATQGRASSSARNRPVPTSTIRGRRASPVAASTSALLVWLWPLTLT